MGSNGIYEQDKNIMRLKTRLNKAIPTLIISSILGLGFSLIALPAPLGFWPADAGAANAVRYVAPGGTDDCNPCTNSPTLCATVQHAVDMAGSGDEMQIAAGVPYRGE